MRGFLVRKRWRQKKVSAGPEHDADPFLLKLYSVIESRSPEVCRDVPLCRRRRCTFRSVSEDEAVV